MYVKEERFPLGVVLLVSRLWLILAMDSFFPSMKICEYHLPFDNVVLSSGMSRNCEHNNLNRTCNNRWIKIFYLLFVWHFELLVAFFFIISHYFIFNPYYPKRRFFPFFLIFCLFVVVFFICLFPYIFFPLSLSLSWISDTCRQDKTNVNNSYMNLLHHHHRTNKSISIICTNDLLNEWIKYDNIEFR